MNDAGILSRAAEVVGRFPSRRVLVVGDIMLDEYVFGTVGRGTSATDLLTRLCTGIGAPS